METTANDQILILIWELKEGVSTSKETYQIDAQKIKYLSGI